MAYAFVASFDSGNTVSGNGVFTSWTVATGDCVALVAVCGTGTTITNVSDGTNTYAPVGSLTIANGFAFQWFYKANVTAVASGTLTVTKGAADTNNAVIAIRSTGLANSVAQTAGLLFTASTVLTTDATLGPSLSATSIPAITLSIMIDMQGSAVNAGSNGTGLANFANLPASAFGWQGRIESVATPNTSAQQAFFTATTAAHAAVGLSIILPLPAAGGGNTGAKMSDMNLLLTPLALSDGLAPTVNIAATSAASANVALAVPVSSVQGGMNQVQVFNAGATTVFVAFAATSGKAVATQTNSYPVPAGFLVTLTPPAGSAFGAAISAVASGPVYFTSANGR